MEKFKNRLFPSYTVHLTYKSNPDLAISSYSREIELNPKSCDAYFRRGLAYYAKGDLDHAILDFTKTIDLFPYNCDAYRYRAICFTLKAAEDNKKASETEFNIDGMQQFQLKPVVYLYPPRKTDLSIKLDYKGTLTVSYPRYDESLKGWNVTAFPDGRLINRSDKKEYSYLFWEGIPTQALSDDFKEGFIVEGQNSAEFLQDVLQKLGLTPKEYNEFIVYWYPKMKDNKYNLVRFAGEEYESSAKLEITPKPDSILRVFMVFKSIDKSVEIKPQIIKPFRRKGFTAVEWGGSELK